MWRLISGLSISVYWFPPPHPFARKILSWLLTFLVTLEIKEEWALQLCSLTVWAIQGPLNFHMNFRIILSISPKEKNRIFIQAALNLRINLGNPAVLKVLFSGPWTWDVALSTSFNKIFEVFSIQMSLVLLLKDLFLDFLFFWCYCTSNCFPNYIFMLFVVRCI